jgi:hypothetical protein
LARQFLAERGLLSRRWTATSGVLTHIQSGNGDLATQISVVQNFIVQGVDMILISPSDPKGIVPVIRQAAAAGIPVMAVNTKADTGAGAQVVAYVGVDDFVFGQRQPRRGRALMKTNEEIVATGFTFPEGPCINRAGVLHLVELRNRYVSRVVDGRRIVFAELGWSPNGAAFGPDGGLYTCNSGGNWPPTPSTNGVAGFGGETPSIQVVQPDGARRSILTQIEGRRLNAPNDICFDAKGGFYFSDPAWAARTPEGVARAEHSPPGDISYVAPDGRASRVAGDLLFPNGLCVSPDGQSLIVAETPHRARARKRT